MGRFQINKITSSSVIDFAAEELKKYLRMMMPDCGEVTVSYNPNATEGFRLGIMDDFGLDTSEAEDLVLDDILHIDTDEVGGIIAGSNARSVLLAVYRYLTMNGCRWLFPGSDGEMIPLCEIKPTKYHKMADCRYRGQCNEGAESQKSMLDAIAFAPKIGLNVFMLEFFNPRVYYDAYYDHTYNEKNREPEPVNPDQVVQWKRECEAEIAKRGLQFHDIGHGWSTVAFNIKDNGGWVAVDESEVLPEESRPFLAQINGTRGLFHGIPVVTNYCMSNPEARAKFVKTIADFAENETNVDYLHVWMADSRNNHCECEECAKMRPSDWYMVVMNELDEELTKRGLATRIVFICYTDTTWGPEVIKLNNPDRFSLLVAAISRNYAELVDPNLDFSKIELAPYVRNNITLPTSVNGYLAHAHEWTEHLGVKSLVYEYHFWLPQYRDFGALDSAKVVYDDILGYKANGLAGIIEDGSHRSFFPNGFAFYVYGRTLFDTSLSFEELKEDFFSHAYGTDWKEVLSFFETISKAMDFRFLNGKLSIDREKGDYYNPGLVEELRKVPDIVKEFTPFVEAHKNMPQRAQTRMMRILSRYLEYLTGMSKVLIYKALGGGMEAQSAFYELMDDFGKYEMEMEDCFDLYMLVMAYRRLFGFRGDYMPF